jgi:DedD protein
MTRMAATDDRDDDRPRSILSAMWFRVVMVIVVLGVITVLAVPHVIDLVNAPPTRQAASVKLAPPTPTMPPTEPVTSPPTPSEGAAPASEAQPPPAQSTEMAKAAEPSPTMAEPKASEPAKPSASRPSAAVGKVGDTRGAGRASRGAYWVQVGSFRDQAAAQRLAERLRSENYSVTESVKRTGKPPSSAPAGEAGDRYNVFVSGAAPAELTARLGAKGLTADVVAGGAVIKPSLSLREAVALSRDLSADGLQVQVRRAGRADAAAPTPGGGDAFHRVRVGSFPDRASALAVAKELEAKGYQPYIARGSQ